MSAEKPPPRRIPRKPAPIAPEKQEQILVGLQKVIGKARSRKKGEAPSSPQNAAPSPAVVSPESTRPTITIGNDGNQVVQAATKVLLHRPGETPRVYRSDTSPPSLVALEVVGGSTVIGAPWSRDRLLGTLISQARWEKLRVIKGEIKAEQIPEPPAYVCKILTAEPPPDLPLLRGLAAGPFLDVGGRLVTQKGYDAGSGLYLSSDFRPQITGWTVERVKELWTDWLTDFPFEEDADRAHALALYLLPFLRPMIEGPTPLHMIDAPTENSGKSLLLRILLLPGIGSPPELYSLPESRAEQQKLLLSALLAGRPVIAFDNVNGEVGGPDLERVLTSTVTTDRVLGVSQTATVQNRAIWALTGNNCTLSRDMVRRTARLRLDAGMSDPGERTYTHPNIQRWTTERRAELAGAALWIAQEWIRAGEPFAANIPTLPSFEDWSRIIGGILAYVGFPGFLQDRKDLKASANPIEQEWRELLSLWIQQFPRENAQGGYGMSREVRSAELVELAETHHLLYGLRKGDKTAAVASFGLAMAKQIRRVYLLEREALQDAQKRLRQTEPTSLPGPEPLPGDYRVQRRVSHKAGCYVLVHRSLWGER